jgi:hypothetical protein
MFLYGSEYAVWEKITRGPKPLLAIVLHKQMLAPLLHYVAVAHHLADYVLFSAQS